MWQTGCPCRAYRMRVGTTQAVTALSSVRKSTHAGRSSRPRLRQLHDEPRSGGNQPAYQRMINRRFNDRASCFAQRRPYYE